MQHVLLHLSSQNLFLFVSIPNHLISIFIDPRINGCMSLLLLTRNLKSNELYETHKRNVYGLLVQIQNSNMLHMHACDGCSWP